jgi:hypothetical protein
MRNFLDCGNGGDDYGIDEDNEVMEDAKSDGDLLALTMNTNIRQVKVRSSHSHTQF